MGVGARLGLSVGRGSGRKGVREEAAGGRESRSGIRGARSERAAGRRGGCARLEPFELVESEHARPLLLHAGALVGSVGGAGGIVWRLEAGSSQNRGPEAQAVRRRRRRVGLRGVAPEGRLVAREVAGDEAVPDLLRHDCSAVTDVGNVRFLATDVHGDGGRAWRSASGRAAIREAFHGSVERRARRGPRKGHSPDIVSSIGCLWS